MVLPVEEHTALVREYLVAAEQTQRPGATMPVVINGSFCEQPPLALIKSSQATAMVVDDDFMLVTRWLQGDVPADGDPLKELARAFPAPVGLHRRQVRRHARGEGRIF